MSGTGDPERWNVWIQFLAAVGAGGLAVMRYGRSGIDWFRRLGRAVVLSDRLHAHYGADAADALKTILDAAGQSISVAELERHLLAERCGVGFYICDPEGACVAASDYLCEMFQTDSRDMLGRGWLINVIDREGVFRKWQTAVRLGLPYDAEYRMHLADNIERTAHTRAYAITTTDRVVLCYVGYVEWVE